MEVYKGVKRKVGDGNMIVEEFFYLGLS